MIRDVTTEDKINGLDGQQVSVPQLDVANVGVANAPLGLQPLSSAEIDDDDDTDDSDDLALDFLGFDEVALDNPLFTAEPSEDDKALDEMLFGNAPSGFESSSTRPAACLGKILTVDTTQHAFETVLSNNLDGAAIAVANRPALVSQQYP